MKKSRISLLFPLIVILFAGCKNQQERQRTEQWQQYHDEYVYDVPAYEPIDVVRDGAYPYTITVVGIPSSGIKQAAWDDNSIKLRCFYSDGAMIDHSFQEKNIPIDFRHYLGELGTHKLSIRYGLSSLSFDFTIIANPNFPGYTCYFFDHNEKLIHTQTVGYYGTVVYGGPSLDVDTEDDNYKYHFVGWNREMKNIHQDTQFKAVMEKTEKRYYAIKPYQSSYVTIGSVVNNTTQKGSALFYLGRVRRAAAIFTETKYLGGSDLTFKFSYSDFSPYWNDLNANVIGSIKYENDPDYDSSIYGSIANVLAHPNYTTALDGKYNYHGGNKVYLENKQDVTMSGNGPYDYVANDVLKWIDGEVTVKLGDNVKGYYRLAVIYDFDVYCSMSFKRIGNKVYEIGDFNEFTVCPVANSAERVVQFSKDENFKENFDTSLSLSSRAVYNNANSIDWNEWQ